MKKMDEMERHIQMVAQVWAYRALMLALCLWTLFNCWESLARGAEYRPLPGLLTCAAAGVQGFGMLFLRQKMVEQDEEYREPNRFLRAVAVTILGAVILLWAGVWLAGLGA